LLRPRTRRDEGEGREYGQEQKQAAHGSSVFLREFYRVDARDRGRRRSDDRKPSVLPSSRAAVMPRAPFSATTEGDITMGLFDFVKDIGKKLFPPEAKPEDAATKIRHEIEGAGLGITNLEVAFAAGKCTLAGDCPSAEAMQKAVLIAGNVQGVSEVGISGLKVPPPKEKVEYYIIAKGDTLSKIAKQYYGDANKYPRIFDANREVIKDANLIYPGQKIRIPMD
jgi:nucleoid-associated protein YgaU